MSVLELATTDFDRFLQDRQPVAADDLAAISAALDRAAAGRATRVAVCGAAGSGRTRLIEHARRDADRAAMRVLATHGRTSDTDIAYAAMLTLLHPVIERIDELPPGERDSLRAAVDLRADEVDERAARTGLWRLLTRLGEERPLLITIDDSDVLDAATAGVVSFALGRMDSQPVAAVVAADSSHPSNPLVALGDETIVLDELDGDSLVRAVRALAPATDAVIRRMAAFADGDQVVAAELVGGLSADQRAGRSACPLVPAHLPRQFVDAHASTLDSFDDASVTALALIAADTTEDARLVGVALERLGHGADALAGLELDGHITVEGTTMRVRRPLLEVAAYQRLAPAARRAVHAALASLMTAEHLAASRAWQLAEAADGRATDSSEAMSAVATTAAERGDYRQAAVAHERAAELAEGHDRRSVSLIAALGLWTALGDVAAMRRLLGTPRDDVATRVARSAALRWLDGEGAAVAELRAAAPQAIDDQPALLDALFADAAYSCGQVRQAIETARRVASRSSGPAHALATALVVLGGEAPAASLDAPDLQPSSSAIVAVVTGRAALRQAEAHLLAGDIDAAEAALGAADHAGPRPWDPAERMALLARVTMARGHPASALQALDGALDRTPAGADVARAVLRLARAEAAFMIGDGESAMSTLEEIVPIFQGAGMARLEAAAQRTVGRIAWSVGQHDVAVACLERARRLDPTAPVGDLVALLAALGRDQDARAWLGRIDRRPSDSAVPIDVLRARANVATEAAVLEAVATVLRRQHLVAAEAELLVDLTAWHHRRGRWSDVYRTAEQAVRLLIPSGMKAWFDRLDQLEPPANAVSGDVPNVLVPLTDAERRVAMAVSRGISNRQVSAELFLSIKTVDSHLQRIYPKLGIRSRAELAALVNAAGVAGRSGASGGGLGPSTGHLPDAGR